MNRINLLHYSFKHVYTLWLHWSTLTRPCRCVLYTLPLVAITSILTLSVSLSNYLCLFSSWGTSTGTILYEETLLRPRTRIGFLIAYADFLWDTWTMICLHRILWHRLLDMRGFLPLLRLSLRQICLEEICVAVWLWSLPTSYSLLVSHSLSTLLQMEKLSDGFSGCDTWCGPYLL